MSEPLKHSLKIDDDNTVTVSGVVNADSICDKEAVLAISRGRLTIKGKNLNINKLDVEQGTLTLNSDGIDSVTYSGGANKEKFSFKGLFK